MSAGELGHTAEAVEVALRDVLEISTKWGAILLLDECDVFLEQRTISDIERNKLVSGNKSPSILRLDLITFFIHASFEHRTLQY